MRIREQKVHRNASKQPREKAIGLISAGRGVYSRSGAINSFSGARCLHYSRRNLQRRNMLLALTPTYGFRLSASDGDIGKANEFYFDDRDWKVRYLIADVGSWLAGRNVLIPTNYVEWTGIEQFQLRLTKQQISDSPPSDTKLPVSLEYEGRLFDYYHLPYYWTPYPVIGFVPPAALPAMAVPRTKEVEQPPVQTHLRSTKEIAGYRIVASNGDGGKCTDFIAQTESWIIRHLVVETGGLLTGKKVLIAPDWITRIEWADKTLGADSHTVTQIQNAPDFDPSQPVNKVLEEHYYDFYGRPAIRASVKTWPKHES